jgi:hypothetical protein
MERLATQLGELREYSAYYLAAKMDQAKLTVRHALAMAILATLGLFTAFSMIFVATWLVLHGIAGGIQAVLAGPAWLASLSLGVFVLASLSGTVAWQLHRWTRKSHSKAIARYEERQHDQKARFGTNAREQADATRERT